jgi:hypothetical protein
MGHGCRARRLGDWRHLDGGRNLIETGDAHAQFRNNLLQLIEGDVHTLARHTARAFVALHEGDLGFAAGPASAASSIAIDNPPDSQ